MREAFSAANSRPRAPSRRPD